LNNRLENWTITADTPDGIVLTSSGGAAGLIMILFPLMFGGFPLYLLFTKQISGGPIFLLYIFPLIGVVVFICGIFSLFSRSQELIDCEQDFSRS